MRAARKRHGTPMREHAVAEVCVIGAGIAGLSVAYELTRRGTPVTVIDQGQVGAGETGHTTAHLSDALDDRYYRLERTRGAAMAKLAAHSHRAAIDRIEALATSLEARCDFARVDGYLIAAPGRSVDELGREKDAARRAGLAVEMVDAAPMPWATGPALKFPGQARFDPLGYLDALADAVVAQGGTIHTGVHVQGLERDGDGAIRLTCDRDRTIIASAVVDATNTAISSMVRMQLRQAAYRSYAISLELGEAEVGDCLLWDTGDPYHYIRRARDADGRELVIVGGEDHRTGQDVDTTSRWIALEEWCRAHGLSGRVVDRWSGQIMEPADGTAFIGKSPDLDGVYIVTGDSGNGITHGVIAGMMIPELIAGRDHPWSKLYAPDRSMLRSIGHLIREAASSTAQYTDWLSGGDLADVAAIPRGAGALIRRGLHLLAVYRDDAGCLHANSARCPHLSAVVSWNDAERSWDCPAHGSRFDGRGHCIHGPAVGDLEPAEELETAEVAKVSA